ncbi:MAG: tRNA preQ1(34) S-adenosylmethionine ribosyltransferase-isomerase QueA [Caldiserica bacterium]|nr:tRNA preQ1(34) S-adenosylmethionine ribosyltransferase-isomerase QueA [Caldisericota bacterium]
MNIGDFDYELPQGLIAQTPLEQRDLARLMVVGRAAGTIEHKRFRDLPDYLRPRDVIVVNDTRVNEASFTCRKDATGAAIDVLLTARKSPTRFIALVRPLKRLHVGETCTVTSDVSLWLLERNDDGDATVEFSHDPYASDEFRAKARVQIPPYIKQFPDDPGAYQTVYAREPGSVAAPTAGLHFTPELLARIRALGIDIQHVTLDVGLGTFQPVRVERVEDHHMHTERFTLPEETAKAVNAARANHATVTAVGTTVARTLESCIKPDGTVKADSGETSIFIFPPYTFCAFDHLVTNFHLPKSTLLMLVGAFMGMDLMWTAYREAIREQYRFFSFGDAMLIL